MSGPIGDGRMAEQPDTSTPQIGEAQTGSPVVTRRAALLGLAASSLIGAGAVVKKATGYDAAPRTDLPSPNVSTEAAAANPGTIAAAKGLVFGSCLNGAFGRDAHYRAITLQYSNTLVPGAATQWMNVQPQPGGAYDFSLCDQMYAWAHAAGRAFRTAAIIDWTYLPKWLPAMVSHESVGGAETLLKRYVQTAAAHWRGRSIEQMAVNEATTSRGMNPSLWYDKLGEDYIDLAFNVAHQADPGTRLMINESEIEMDDRSQRAKLDNYLALIHRLKHRGVPVGSVGIEGHLKSDSAVNQKGLEDFMKELAAMNLSFMITELDVDDRGLPDDLRARDAGVAAIMRDLLDVALEQPNCEGVTMWDFSDHDNWIVRDDRFRRHRGGPQRPALLDAGYKPKASWAVLIDCLKRARGPAPGSRILPDYAHAG